MALRKNQVSHTPTITFIIFPIISVDVSMKTCGPKEESGFTHAYNEEPITFIPGNPHKNDRPVGVTFQRKVDSVIKIISQLMRNKEEKKNP